MQQKTLFEIYVDLRPAGEAAEAAEDMKRVPMRTVDEDWDRDRSKHFSVFFSSFFSGAKSGYPQIQALLLSG